MVWLFFSLLTIFGPEINRYESYADDGSLVEAVYVPAELVGRGFDAVSEGERGRYTMHFDYDAPSRCYVSARIVICKPGARSNAPQGGQVVTIGD